jgi:hypothetical protein
MRSSAGWPTAARHALRLGAMSDKAVIERCQDTFDVLVVQGNLAVSAPQGLASWTALDKPFWIDPITYAFAADPAYLRPRKRPGQAAPGPGTYKRTFAALALAFGEPFQTALREGRVLRPEDFDAATTQRAATRVLEWQRTIFNAPEEDQKYGVPATLEPVLLTIPFFPLHHRGEGREPDWLRTNLALVRHAVDVEPADRLAVGLLLEPELLDDWGYFEPYWQAYVDQMSQLGVRHLWLWVSDNEEKMMSVIRARRLLSLIAAAKSAGLVVHQAFGGSFSAFALSRGLDSVAHGVNYWESKGWQPIASGGLPTARFFYPPLRERLRVPEAIALVSGAIADAADFHERVCGCPVCHGVVREDIADFGRYGEVSIKTRRTASGGTAEFDSPTSEALQLTKAHYLQAKAIEVQLATDGDFDPARHLRDASEEHASDVARTSHLLAWANAFDPEAS